MTCIPARTYSSLNRSTNEVGVTIGTGTWFMPTNNAQTAKAGFGQIGALVSLQASAHSEVYGAKVVNYGARDNGYFSTYGIVHSIGTATFKTSVVYAAAHMEKGNSAFVPIKTIHHSTSLNLTPYRYVQSTNGTGAASLNMGFDTKQSALDFTQNFYGVTTFSAYNGFVYNLEVDKSFVCEIYYNGPISGLMQGG